MKASDKDWPTSLFMKKPYPVEDFKFNTSHCVRSPISHHMSGTPKQSPTTHNKKTLDCFCQFQTSSYEKDLSEYHDSQYRRGTSHTSHYEEASGSSSPYPERASGFFSSFTSYLMIELHHTRPQIIRVSEFSHPIREPSDFFLSPQLALWDCPTLHLMRSHFMAAGLPNFFQIAHLALWESLNLWESRCPALHPINCPTPHLMRRPHDFFSFYTSPYERNPHTSQ